MKPESKLIAELVDHLLSKLISYARKSSITIYDILQLEEQLKKGIHLLNLQQQLNLVSQIVSGNFLKSIVKLDYNSGSHLEELCNNILLFNSASPIDSFLVSKFLVSFLLQTEKERTTFSEEVAEEEALIIDINERVESYQPDYGEYYLSHRFGNHHRSRLNLSGKEAKLLNKVGVEGTVFTEIRQCADESAKLFLCLIKNMEQWYNKKGKDFLDMLDTLDKFQNQENEYYSDWYTPVTSSVFEGLFKIAENTIRAHYRHTRKREEEYIYIHLERDLGFNPKEYLAKAIDSYQSKIEQPTLETILTLNELTRTRWKEEFETIKSKAKTLTPQEITQRIYQLFDENTKNSSRANIYYEATKLFVSFNRQETLKCYLQYYVLKSQQKKGATKVLPKRITKQLFTEKEHGERFVKIISQLSQHGQLNIALKDLANIFRKERKRIQIDSVKVNKIKEIHKKTVEKLNVILSDSNEPPEKIASLPKEKQVVTEEEKSLEDVFGKPEEGKINIAIELDAIHLKLLHLFKAKNRCLTNEELTIFAKENRKLKRQVVDKINELFYDKYEDVLIEDTEEGYKINKEYNDFINDI